MLRKIISLVLVLLLLGQNIAFANVRIPQSLQECRKVITKELDKSDDWLRNNAEYLIGIFGGIAILSAFLTSYMREELTALKTENKNLASLNKKLEIDKKNISELDAEIKRLNNEIKDLNRNNKINKGKLESAQRKLEKAKRERQSLVTELNKKKNRITHYRTVIKNLEQERDLYIEMLNLPKIANAQEYIKLFQDGVSSKTRDRLLKQLEEEPWVKEMQVGTRSEFMRFMEQASESACAKAGHAPITYINMLLGRASAYPFRAYTPYLKSLAHHLMKSKNVFTVAAVLSLGWATTAEVNAQNDQKEATRIAKNFKLFLSASDAQIAAWEKKPLQKQTILQATELLLHVSSLGKEKSDMLVAFVKKIKSKETEQQFLNGMKSLHTNKAR